jgi:hypothetical protein
MHINAVDMHTVGIGGDSLVQLNRSGQLTVGPFRVQPLAMSQGIADNDPCLLFIDTTAAPGCGLLRLDMIHECFSQGRKVF